MSKETIKCTDENIKQIVKEQIELLGNEADLNHLDVSSVTDMSDLFYCSEFNGDISQWDVSNVESMRGMFFGTTSFNSDISNWNTPNLMNMDNMLYDAEAFVIDISSWDTSWVSDTSQYFYYLRNRKKNIYRLNAKRKRRLIAAEKRALTSKKDEG